MINLDIAKSLKDNFVIKIDGIKGFGSQYLFRFENNYGASVVHQWRADSDADLWELAVTKYEGDIWHLCYTSGITDDVIPRLTSKEVMDVLRKIKNL